MSSFIYISSAGADPEMGLPLTDPLFGPVPTLGACVPNLRRLVLKGDWIFVVSGRRARLPQYIVGGLRVSERITALEAYHRFPQYRMQINASGLVEGNIPVDANGDKHALDRHRDENFAQRIENYLVGDQSIHLDRADEIRIARDQSLPFLSDLKSKPANRIYDIIGRASKLKPEEVERTLQWLSEIKNSTK